MTDYYKLTDKDGLTHGKTSWGPGMTHSAEGEGWAFCSDELIHFYDDPLLAVLLNPTHGNFSDPRLWKGTATGKVVSDSGLKYGAKTFTIDEELPVPVVSREQRVKFAILCAKQVYTEPSWTRWAEDWLSGKDRSAWAAWATAWAARVGEAAWAAAMAAAWEAAWAAWEAAWAAAMAAATKPLDIKALAREAMA